MYNQLHIFSQKHILKCVRFFNFTSRFRMNQHILSTQNTKHDTDLHESYISPTSKIYSLSPTNTNDIEYNFEMSRLQAWVISLLSAITVSNSPFCKNLIQECTYQAIRSRINNSISNPSELCNLGNLLFRYLMGSKHKSDTWCDQSRLERLLVGL